LQHIVVAVSQPPQFAVAKRRPYRVWLSEICCGTVSTVLDYYAAFDQVFPMANLAAADADGHESGGPRILQPCAVYPFMPRCGGIALVLSTAQQLTLPGVRSALRQSRLLFGERVAILDGNVKGC
jgi:hypothetical protein